MRIILLPAFLIVLLAACGNKNRIPSGVLQPRQMEAVLWDLMRADQFLADYVFSKDTSKKQDQESIRMYTQIFRTHNISKETFQKSFEFYQHHPALMNPILDSISKKKLTMPAMVLPQKGARPADTTTRPTTQTGQPAQVTDTTKKLKAIRPD